MGETYRGLELVGDVGVGMRNPLNPGMGGPRREEKVAVKSWGSSLQDRVRSTKTMMICRKV